MMKIGIFWIYDNIIHTKKDTAKNHTSADGISDLSIAHYDYWVVLQKRFKDLRDLGYDEVPRGRVLKKQETFFVYGSESMLASQSNRLLIKKAFEKEAMDNVQFIADEHYRDIKHLGFENFEW